MSKKQSYHHGNLREAFLNVACELLEKDGLANLSLRKCAENVGVSHTAFKNHFSNMAGLLTAIVTYGYSKLSMMMTTNVNDASSREHRRKEALTGYIKFAEFNPALYELMFSRDRFINDDPVLLTEIGKCFNILVDVSEELNWHQGTSKEVSGKSQVALWSFVHGYAQLVTARRFKKEQMQGLSVMDILPDTKK